MMSNVIEQFIEARKKLLQELTIEDGYYIDFRLDVPWSLQGEDDVSWLDEGDEFGADIVNKDITVTSHHTVVLIDNGCGETFYTVFKNVERVDELPY